MKISKLIRRLQEAQDHCGDLDVVVGETSSQLRGIIDVNVDTRGNYDGNWDEKICIVQAYMRLA